MIDASQIMPLNFFMYKGVYSGEHHGMRYRIKKAGEKPDEVLEAYVWQKPYSFAATPKEEIISDTFPLSEEGRLQLVDWLKQMYEKDDGRVLPQYWKHPLTSMQFIPIRIKSSI